MNEEPDIPPPPDFDSHPEFREVPVGIPKGSPGARNLVTALESDCKRFRAIVAAGSSPDRVAQRFYQLEPPEISPLAKAAGQIFEIELTRKDGEKLIDLYARNGFNVTGLKFDTFEHFTPPADELPQNDGTLTAEEFEEITATFIEEKRAKHNLEQADKAAEVIRDFLDYKGTPTVIVQVPMVLRFAGHERVVVPDVMFPERYLVEENGKQVERRRWRLGDIKSYLDRDGRTNKESVASATKQIAVGVIATRQMAERFGHDPDVVVASEADLILRSVSSNFGSLTCLPVSEDIRAFKLNFERLTEESTVLTNVTSKHELEEVEHVYTRECRTVCDLASKCSTEAMRKGEVPVDWPGAEEARAISTSLSDLIQVASGQTNVQKSSAAQILRKSWERTRSVE